MGATHHALEDYGALLCLPHLRAYVPAFDGDVRADGRARCSTVAHPAYLRLGPLGGAAGRRRSRPTRPGGGCWTGGAGWCWSVGPLVGGIWEAVRQLDEAARPALWLLTELPLDEPPDAVPRRPRPVRRLLVVEEHVAQGGVGQMIAAALLEAGMRPERFAIADGPGLPLGPVRLAEVPPAASAASTPPSVVEFLTSGDA